jgi:hypothetical protein
MADNRRIAYCASDAGVKRYDAYRRPMLISGVNVSIGFCNGGGGGPTWFNQSTSTTWL